jgi:hypothetical protein
MVCTLFGASGLTRVRSDLLTIVQSGQLTRLLGEPSPVLAAALRRVVAKRLPRAVAVRRVVMHTG